MMEKSGFTGEKEAQKLQEGLEISPSFLIRAKSHTWQQY